MNNESSLIKLLKIACKSWLKEKLKEVEKLELELKEIKRELENGRN